MGTGLGFGLRLHRAYQEAPKKGAGPRTTCEVHLRAETSPVWLRPFLCLLFIPIKTGWKKKVAHDLMRLQSH